MEKTISISKDTAVFRDFIPEGEELGGLGDGFKDFVPEKKPVFQPVENPIEEEAKEDKPVISKAVERDTNGKFKKPV